MVILSCAPNYVCLDFGGMSLSCLLYYPLSLHSTKPLSVIKKYIALTPSSCHSLYTALFQSFAWHCFIWDILQGWNIFCNLLNQEKKERTRNLFFPIAGNFIVSNGFVMSHESWTPNLTRTWFDPEINQVNFIKWVNATFQWSWFERDVANYTFIE